MPVLYSILACLFWGLIFCSPLYLADFACIDIVLGRFLVFGIGSLIALAYHVTKHQDWQLLTHWKAASCCAIVMNLSYFTALTVGIRLSNPSVVTLIVGMAPILIVGLSCRKNLLRPALCIVTGVALVNIETLRANWQSYTAWQYIQGILCGFFALGAWTWYVIYNTEFLHKNPNIRPTGWTFLIGAVTLIFALIATLLRWWIVDAEYTQRFSLSEQGLPFIIGSLVLGLLCSLSAFTLWNIASSQIHSALSGQLATLETVFGLMFIHWLQQRVPNILEIIGTLCILGGIWRGLYSFNNESLFKI